MARGGWLSRKQYKDKYDISQRTITRHIKSGKIQSKEIGGRRRIWDAEQDHPNAGDDQAHQSVIMDTLGSAAFDVRPYVDSFPTVYGWSYRIDDPSNALGWKTVSGRPHVELNLSVEREHAWQYAYEHLETGLTQTLAALKTVKQSMGLYWQTICKLEEQYRAEVEELAGREWHSVQIDDGHFYRSILSEVDNSQSTPRLDDYEVRAHADGVSVVKVVRAPDDDLARRCMKKHLEWRKLFVTNEKNSLHLLRSEVQFSAKQFVDVIGDLEVAGRLPGLCAKCDPSRMAQDT